MLILSEMEQKRRGCGVLGRMTYEFDGKSSLNDVGLGLSGILEFKK